LYAETGGVGSHSELKFALLARYSKHEKPGNPTMSNDSVRIDKWLWAARFFKTRSMATAAVDNGKVKLNGDRVKPARGVKPGDRLDVDNGATEWEVLVKELSDVRRAASFAQALYAETEESIKKRALAAEDRRYFREPGADMKGRPTKRDRRLINRSQS
jgi:ribosome-associated heat shock protein Hsp15